MTKKGRIRYLKIQYRVQCPREGKHPKPLTLRVCKLCKYHKKVDSEGYVKCSFPLKKVHERRTSYKKGW